MPPFASCGMYTDVSAVGPPDVWSKSAVTTLTSDLWPFQRKRGVAGGGRTHLLFALVI